MKGKFIRSPEIRLKTSQSLKGRHVSPKTEWKKGEKPVNSKCTSGMKGLKHTEQTKSKMRGPRLSMKGENHPCWKGGISPIAFRIRNSCEYKLWRKSVFERDNYTCIFCGQQGRVEADHIKPFSLFPELRFAIDNGRTLCHECHKTTDTYSGKLNSRSVKN